jgi:hypothetical protein
MEETSRGLAPIGGYATTLIVAGATQRFGRLPLLAGRLGLPAATRTVACSNSADRQAALKCGRQREFSMATSRPAPLGIGLRHVLICPGRSMKNLAARVAALGPFRCFPDMPPRLPCTQRRLPSRASFAATAKEGFSSTEDHPVGRLTRSLSSGKATGNSGAWSEPRFPDCDASAWQDQDIPRACGLAAPRSKPQRLPASAK